MTERPALRFYALLFCFFVSGFAALLYETVWTREFAAVFGTSELAVAAVLAAYMAGLAGGAMLAARLVSRLRRPVLAYGTLELGIALGALAVPLGIRGVTYVYALLLSRGDAPPSHMGWPETLFQLAGAFLVLVPCSALMGATLPLLARWAVDSDDQIAPRVGLLYTANTVGAVTGTLVTAFLLLPEFGLRGTVHLGVVANGLVFLAAALLARGTPSLKIETGPRVKPRASWILPAIAFSGAASFLHEVLWTRMLGFVLGGSTPAFASMLASFLLGIALGSAIAARFARSPAAAARWFAWAQFGTAVTAALAFQLVDLLPWLAASLGATAFHPGPGLLAGLALMLPFTCCIGATFPLAVRLATTHAGDVGDTSGRVYAWNTLGSIVGAVGTGFVLLPALGLSGTMVVGVVVHLALATWTVFREALPKRALLTGTSIGVLLIPLLLSSSPVRLVSNAVLQGEPFPGTLTFLGVGRSATVTLHDNLFISRIATTGLPEAGVETAPTPPRRVNEAEWLALAPVLARPDARRMLIIGLGGAGTLAAVPSSIESIDLVELEPEVVEANRRVPSRRVGDPLADPRLRLHLADARGSLVLSEARYDIVVSQPSHPWTGGASHLYTQEFFELVRNRLDEGGVFVQWIGLPFVDAPLLETLLATLVSVFPEVEVHRPRRGVAVFLASQEPLDTLANAEQALEAFPDDYARFGVRSLEDVAVALAIDSAQARVLVEGVPVNTDDHNRLAARARFARLGIRALDGFIDEGDALAGRLEDFDPAVLARRLVVSRQSARGEKLADAFGPGARQLYLGWMALDRSQNALARQHFELALERDPDSVAALVGHAMATEKEPSPRLPARARAVIAGQADRASGRWAALEARDAALASWRPHELLYPEATRLRVAWRLESGDRERAVEAGTLVDELLTSMGRLTDGLDRARAALQSGESERAWATLSDLADRVPARAKGLRREALRLAAQLPAHPDADSIRERLARRYAVKEGD